MRCSQVAAPPPPSAFGAQPRHARLAHPAPPEGLTAQSLAGQALAAEALAAEALPTGERAARRGTAEPVPAGRLRRAAAGEPGSTPGKPAPGKPAPGKPAPG